MCEDSDGKCTVHNEIKVANVFGQFTSLLTGISLTFPCDPENFEREALGYQDRVVETIQAFQNRILERVGVKKVWHGDEPPEMPSSGSGKKKAGKKKAPAARKRTPRKRS
jgi:hypothetical protein